VGVKGIAGRDGVAPRAGEVKSMPAVSYGAIIRRRGAARQARRLVAFGGTDGRRWELGVMARHSLHGALTNCWHFR
jgi:hypothetical protein